MFVHQNIIGPAEIAQMLGVSRQTVSNWKSRYKDFPRPVNIVNGGPVFDRTAVLVWLISREKRNDGQLIFDFERRKVLNEALFGKEFSPKFGAFEHYNRAIASEIEVGDRIKLTVRDSFDRILIYEAIITLEWGNNFLAMIQRSYTNEMAFEELHHPKVGEHHFIEASMISVGMKPTGSQYAGLIDSDSADSLEFYLHLHSPRWARKTKYRVEMQETHMQFFHSKIKSAKCSWTYETGLKWGTTSVDEILENDHIYSPNKFSQRLEQVYLAFKEGRLSRAQVKEILEELSTWVNMVTEQRPRNSFWEGLF